MKRKIHRLPKLSTLKKKAWKLMSEFTRRRYADRSGYVSCICCGESDLWNSGNIHAGHYIHAGSRRKENNAVSYDERNIWPECFSCNYHDKDNAKHKFSTFMRLKYGDGIDGELRAIKAQSNLKLEDFEMIIATLESRIEYLDNLNKRAA